MVQTVGDFLVKRLHSWGVRRMFGYPGDGINGVFGALVRAEDKIEFIQARHEEMAAFMASAYAKFSGELGVCIATSGPGAISRSTSQVHDLSSCPARTTRDGPATPTPWSTRFRNSLPVFAESRTSIACWLL